jgi:hypothetical protein
VPNPIPQAEADLLRTMPKRLMKQSREMFDMPHAGEGVTFELESMDGRIEFKIDVNRRGKIKLTRCTLGERYRVTDHLARLDIDGAPHTNPTVAVPPLQVLVPHNGRVMPCPHYHFYVEGYEDRWAIPAEEAGFQDTVDLVRATRDFMIHCGVADVPTIQYPIPC